MSSRYALDVKHRVAAWLGSLGVVALAAMGWASPVPSGNEYVYLTLLRKAADSRFLVSDWTFGGGFQEHAVFTATFGPLAEILGPETVAWAGRLVSWLIIGRLLIALGTRLGSPIPATVVAVAVFLGLNQSMGVGSEFLFSHFEAKSVAWPLFLGALVAGVDRRLLMTSVLLGATLSFHSAIGLWGGGGLVTALLLIPETRRQTLKLIPIAALVALPGVIPQIESILESTPNSDAVDLLVFSRIPHHVDPFAFGERGPLILVLMFIFNMTWAWRRRSEYAPTLVGYLHLVLGTGFAVGVVARLTGRFEFLLLQPFRVLPVLAPMIFLLVVGSIVARRGASLVQVSRLWAGRFASRLELISGVLGCIAIIVLWNPIPRWISQVEGNLAVWQRSESGIDQAMGWLSMNSPHEAVVAGPPWVEELFWVTERSQFVSWEAIPYDRISEWRVRLDAAVVDPSVWDRRPDEEELLSTYSSVSLSQWQRIADEWGVNYVMTTARYSDLPVFSSGDWNVYDLDIGE